MFCTLLCVLKLPCPLPELQCINTDSWLVGAAGRSSAQPNLMDRMVGVAMGITAKEPAKRILPDNETSQATAHSAANMTQVSFMAFAVSACIRSSPCPDLQSCSPQPMCLSTCKTWHCCQPWAVQCGFGSRHRNFLLGSMLPASLRFVHVESAFSRIAVISVDCCWLPTLHPHRGFQLYFLTSLQVDIKLKQFAHVPRVA